MTEVASRVPHPEIDRRAPPCRARRRGRRRAGPGRASLPARAGSPLDRGRPGRDLGHRADRATDARGPDRGARRGCGRLDPGRLDRPVRRPGGTPEPEPRPGSRLDRHADPAPRRVVRPGLPCATRRADALALPRRAARGVHAENPDGRRRRSWSGSRDVRRDGHAWVRDEYAIGITLRGGADRRRRAEIVAAVHVHGPSYRFPADGDEDRIAAAVRAAAARIGARLRAGA